MMIAVTTKSKSDQMTRQTSKPPTKREPRTSPNQRARAAKRRMTHRIKTAPERMTPSPVALTMTQMILQTTIPKLRNQVPNQLVQVMPQVLKEV